MTSTTFKQITLPAMTQWVRDRVIIQQSLIAIKRKMTNIFVLHQSNGDGIWEDCLALASDTTHGWTSFPLETIGIHRLPILSEDVYLKLIANPKSQACTTYEQ